MRKLFALTLLILGAFVLLGAQGITLGKGATYGKGMTISPGASGGGPAFTALGTANGNFASPYSIAVGSASGTGTCVIVDLVNNNANGGTTYAVNVTDSKSNTYPTTGSGWYQALGSSIGHTVVIAPVTTPLTTSDHITVTVPVGDGNSGMVAYSVTNCATSSVVDQAIPGNVTNTNTPTTSTLTPGTSPTIAYCSMATPVTSAPTSGNIIGAAATSLGTTQNTAGSDETLAQWLILNAVTAGTCTMAGTGLNGWDYVFVTIKE